MKQKGAAVAFTFLATGLSALAQVNTFAYQPLQSHLLDQGVAKSGIGAIFFWGSFAAYLKVFVAIGLESFPIRGRIARPYFVFGALVTTLGFLGFVIFGDSPATIQTCITVTVLGITFATTALGLAYTQLADSVLSAKSVSAIRQPAQPFFSAFADRIGGLLAGHGLTGVGFVGAALALAQLIVVVLYREPATAVAKPIGTVLRQSLDVVRSRSFMWTILVIFLFTAVPSIGIAQYDYVVKQRHFVTELGYADANALGRFGGFAGVFLAAIILKRIGIRRTLAVGITAEAVATLAFLLYRDFTSAATVTIVYSIASALAETAIFAMVLATAPRTVAIVAVAAAMSVRNFGVVGSNWLGASLMDQGGFTYQGLVLVSAITSLIALPAVFGIRERDFVTSAQNESPDADP